MSVKLSTCPLCEANCGIEVYVENNKIEKVLGDKNDTSSKGYICVKAKALKNLYEDEDRLKTPQIREGNSWREATWQEAIAYAVKGIKEVQRKYGYNAQGVFQGNPLGHSADGVLYYWLLTKLLKTENVFSSASLDQLPHMLVADKLYGNLGMFTIPDIDRTHFMLILGANPVVSNGSIMTAPNVRNRLKNIQKRNGKIVVVDPRKTETAQLANQYISIVPSTDVFFLLSFINVLFEEDLVNIGRLEKNVEGVKELKQLSIKYTPKFVSGLTSIPDDIIVQLVKDFANAPSAILYPRVGASMQEFGTLTHWLAHVINILTGNLDEPGGMMFTKPAIDFVKISKFFGEAGNFGKNKSRVKGYSSFRGEFPTATLLDEMKTEGQGQIKSLITVAGNPVLSSPNGNELEEELKKLDFMVSIDIYKNETTQYANVILPPCFSLEAPRFELVFPIMSVRNRIKYSEPVLKNKYYGKSDGEILKELASRFSPFGFIGRFILSLFSLNILLDFFLKIGNYGSKFIPFKKGLSFRKLREQKHGVDLGALVPMLPKRLFTNNKKIHLSHSIFMEDLERLSAKEEQLNSISENENEFLMIGRRAVRSNNSWFHNLNEFSTDKIDCKLMINTNDAARLSLKESEKVSISSVNGCIQTEVTITDDIKEGVVSLPHGWGHKSKGQSKAIRNPGVNMNELIHHSQVDVLSGTSILSGFNVRVEKVA